MANCEKCGAPVSLIPDGYPLYDKQEATRQVRIENEWQNEILERLWMESISQQCFSDWLDEKYVLSQR